MRRVLSSSTFRFEELKERPTTIYLIIPPERLDTSRQFLRLFLNLGLTRFTHGGKARFPTLFIIDEAHSLGNLRAVARAYGLTAGYNLILWSFFQDKGQLDRLYGAEAGTFVGNSRAVQVFAVSDDTTAKWTSEMLGRKMQAFHAGGSVELRSPGDVRLEVGRGAGRQYILRADKAPLILERAKYWEQEPFKSRVDEDPDHKKRKA
jgi:type IV secretory pathway TraG/TraD family ATPase VirD4